jgi:hypothetical protein
MKRNLGRAFVLWLGLGLIGAWAPVEAQRRARVNNDGCLTGTYQLDRSRSDDASRIAETATRNLGGNRDQVRENLERRLDAPETLALDKRGQTITIGSTRAPQVTFEADGRSRSEQTPQGRNINVRATLLRNQLNVSTTGNRGNDYTMTFEPFDNCRSLSVTRRLSSDRLGQPVLSRSVYSKTDDVAQAVLDNGRETTNYPERSGNQRSGSFIVPDGTQLIAVLDNDLTTRDTRDGDRFTMSVRSPNAYNGAVIEGFVRDAKRSGRISGRAGIYLDFDRIRMRNGRSGEFAGTIESVRTADGSDVRVDEESGVREDDSQGTRTVTRTGIGAALGAIIGAVAGGGKGAAIGAAVGAATGAGSVIVQGRDDLNLQRGTEITLRASAPRS